MMWSVRAQGSWINITAPKSRLVDGLMDETDALDLAALLGYPASQAVKELCLVCGNESDANEFLNTQTSSGGVLRKCLTCAGLMAMEWIESGCPNCRGAGERVRAVIVAYHQQERRVYAPAIDPANVPPHSPECEWAK